MDNLQHSGKGVGFPHRAGFPDDFTGAPRAFFGQGHHVRPHRGHLGPAVIAQDGRHDVASEGGAGLQEIALAIDGEPRAIRGQPGGDHRSHRARQIPAEAGGAHEDDFRLVLIDQVAHHRPVGLGAVMLEHGRVDEVNLIRAVGGGLLAEMLNALAKDNGGQRNFQGVRQLASLAQQFPGDLMGFAIGLLDEHPNPAIGGQLGGQSGRFFVLRLARVVRRFLGLELRENFLFFRREKNLQSLSRADFDAFEAADAFGEKDGRFALFAHLDGVDRAGALAARAAGGAFSIQ